MGHRQVLFRKVLQHIPKKRKDLLVLARRVQVRKEGLIQHLLTEVVMTAEHKEAVRIEAQEALATEVLKARDVLEIKTETNQDRKEIAVVQVDRLLPQWIFPLRSRRETQVTEIKIKTKIS